MFLIIFSIYISFLFHSTSHNLTRSNLIQIYHFSLDSVSLSSQVPDTSNSLPLVQPIYIDYSVGNDTLFFGTLEAPFFSIVPLTCLRLWIHFYVNPYVFVSPTSYQTLFLLIILFHFFLVFIHCLSSYK